MEPINQNQEINLTINGQNRERFIADLQMFLQNVPGNLDLYFTIRADPQAEDILSELRAKLEQYKSVIHGPKHDQVQEKIIQQNERICKGLQYCQKEQSSTKYSIQSKVTRFTEDIKNIIDQTRQYIHSLRRGIQVRECQSPTKSGVGRAFIGMPNESIVQNLERLILQLENTLNYQFGRLRIQNGGVGGTMEEQQ